MNSFTAARLNGPGRHFGGTDRMSGIGQSMVGERARQQCHGWRADQDSPGIDAWAGR